MQLPHARKIVLLAIADHYNEKTGRCDPSVATLSTMCGMSIRGVQMQIKALVSDGLLRREERSGTSPSYTLHPRTSCTPTPARDAPPDDDLDTPTPEPHAPLPPHDVHPTPARDAPKPLCNQESKKRKTRAKKSEITFREFAKQCAANGDALIPADHGVFSYAQKINLPFEFLRLSWFVFESRFSDSDKTYRDWRATFRNYVERGWLGLWYVDRQTGEYLLTTPGLQAAREHGIGMPLAEHEQ